MSEKPGLSSKNVGSKPGFISRLNSIEFFPLLTPRYVLAGLLAYASFFVLVGALLLGVASSSQQIRIDLQPDASCARSTSSLQAEGSARILTRECTPYPSGVGNSNAFQTDVEKIQLQLDEDIGGDDQEILVYYEIEGLHQNHLRFIKSTQSFDSYRQLRTGDCLDYQKERTDCQKNEPKMVLSKNE